MNSFRIKPPTSRPPNLASSSKSAHLQGPAAPAAPAARRKSMKRRYTVDSDDDETADFEQQDEHAKRARTIIQRHRSRATTDSADEEEAEDAEDAGAEFEVDVVDEEQGHDSDNTENYMVPPPPSTSASMPRRLSTSTSGRSSKAKQVTEPSSKRKRPAVVSESNTDDEFVDPGGGDDHEDFAIEPERFVKGKGRAALPKGYGPTKKGKARLEVTDIKDDRKKVAMRAVSGHTTATEAPATGGVKRPRLKAATRLEDSSVHHEPGGDNIATPDTPSATITHSPPSTKEEPAPPQKKRKLPTIKKNKPATSLTGQGTPSIITTAPTKPGQPPAAKSTALEGGVMPLTTNTRKSTAPLGNPDFDLRNQDVYNELFKNTGGNTPRSGLSRREKNEERRRELNRMRDEARARRGMEAKNAFDLQGQMEKITRFEERLRRERNSALWPNALAAKWRQLWERERRRAKEQEGHERPQSGAVPQEEGEIPEGQR